MMWKVRPVCLSLSLLALVSLTAICFPCIDEEDERQRPRSKSMGRRCSVSAEVMKNSSFSSGQALGVASNFVSRRRRSSVRTEPVEAPTPAKHDHIRVASMGALIMSFTLTFLSPLLSSPLRLCRRTNSARARQSSHSTTNCYRRSVDSCTRTCSRSSWINFLKSQTCSGAALTVLTSTCRCSLCTATCTFRT